MILAFASCFLGRNIPIVKSYLDLLLESSEMEEVEALSELFFLPTSTEVTPAPSVSDTALV